MAIPAATYKTFEQKGIREDLSDVIYRIDPEDTPFTSNIGRGKATAAKHEWQTQALRSATDANAVIEGDDASTDTATATVRVGNYVQTSDKVARVSDFSREVDTAGRKDELLYQVMLAGIELKLDVEKQMLSNKASAAGASGTARVSGSFELWLASNNSHGGTGSTPGYSGTTGLVEAEVDGPQRSWTEAMLKTVMATTYGNGGKPRMLMVGTSLKQQFSAFTGIAQIRKDVPGRAQATIVGAADVYVSDFGNLNVVVNLFQRTRTALLVDPKMASLVTVRGMRNRPLAKTGDSDQRQIIMDYTLKVHNEKAHGKVADLNT